MTTTSSAYNPAQSLDEQVRTYHLIVRARTKLEALHLATYQTQLQRSLDQILALDIKQELECPGGYLWTVTVGLVPLVDPNPPYLAPQPQPQPAAQNPNFHPVGDPVPTADEIYAAVMAKLDARLAQVAATAA